MQPRKFVRRHLGAVEMFAMYGPCLRLRRELNEIQLLLKWRRLQQGRVTVRKALIEYRFSMVLLFAALMGGFVVWCPVFPLPRVAGNGFVR